MIEVDSRLQRWLRRGPFDVRVAGLFAMMLFSQDLAALGIEAGGTPCGIFRPGVLQCHRVPLPDRGDGSFH